MPVGMTRDVECGSLLPFDFAQSRPQAKRANVGASAAWRISLVREQK